MDDDDWVGNVVGTSVDDAKVDNPVGLLVVDIIIVGSPVVSSVS